MKSLVVPTLSLSSLMMGLAIAAPVVAQDAPPKIVATATYRCDEGKGFSAKYRDNETVEARFGSKVLVLPQTESASGARYSDGSVTIFTKGDQAFVDVGDKRLFSNCVVADAVSGLW